ncbi:MAG: hypothetical protein ACOC7T_01440 [Planctomycetota bacterium]
MPVELTCTNEDCGEQFQVGDEMLGEMVECPNCGEAVLVESTEPEQAFPTEESLSLDAGFGTEQGGSDAGEPAEAEEEEEDLVWHPARQECPNCGAVLGVREATCPECGADIRTGAVSEGPAEAEKFNWAPLIIGGGIVVALVVLVVLVLFAVKLLSSRGGGDDGGEQQQVAEQAGQPKPGPERPQGPPQDQPSRPKPQVQLPEQALASLQQREEQTRQAVESYLSKLEQTLSEMSGQGPDQMASRWADLYEFCTENGLHAEAEQAWYRAALLHPDDEEVNRRLGRTETFAGRPVTPEQKQFLSRLQPRLRIVNRNPELEGHVASIEGLENVEMPVGGTVELAMEPGPFVLKIVRASRPDRVVQRFELRADVGVVQTVYLDPTGAAEPLPFQEMAAAYNAVQKGGEGPVAETTTDAEGQIVEATTETLRFAPGSEDPLRMWLSRNQDQLSLVGSIERGNRFRAGGQQLLSGTSGRPLSAVFAGQNQPLVLASGSHCTIEARLSPEMWGILGTLSADLAAEARRRQLADRLEEVDFRNTQMEADGELYGPWQTQPRLYSEMETLRGGLRRRARFQRQAARVSYHRDVLRIAGPGRPEVSRYANWPRFRHALAAYMQGGYQALLERVDAIGPQSVDLSEDASAFAPPSLELGAEDRRRLKAQILPLLPDEVVVERATGEWGAEGGMKGPALAALEKVGSAQAVRTLGRLAQQSVTADETAMALLSLGYIGTPEALSQTQVPSVSSRVQTAAFAARAVAGDFSALERVPAFLEESEDESRYAFLDYVSEFNTPGALLALSDCMESFQGDDASEQIAEALARIGGHAAALKLSALMERTGQIYADQLDRLHGEQALFVVRHVGRALTDEGASAEAIDLLASEGSEASRAYLLTVAANLGSRQALRALLAMGTQEALADARKAASGASLALLSELRSDWYDEDGEWKSREVSPDAGRSFLLAVFQEGSDPGTRVAAAKMLHETGEPVAAERLLEFAQGTPAPASEGGSGGYAPAGFVEPRGRPAVPKDFEFPKAPRFYALGLALESGGQDIESGLRDVAAAGDRGLQAAAMVALGRIGGSQNLQFLRDRATASADPGQNPVRVLEDRLAALHGLSATEDATMLPRLLDMMEESAPSATGVEGVEDQEKFGAWWQLELWRGAVDCVAGITRRRSPRDLTADSDLQQLLSRRLIALIERPGPNVRALSRDRLQLQAASIRAFGRAGDFDTSDNRTVLRRLVSDLAEADGQTVRGAPRRGPQRRPERTRKSPAQTLRPALLDAVAHAAAGHPGQQELVEFVRKLVSDADLQSEWEGLVLEMADYATPGYFAMLSETHDTVSAEMAEAVLAATADRAEQYGAQFAGFIGGLLAPRALAEERGRERAVASRRREPITAEEARTRAREAASEREEAMERLGERMRRQAEQRAQAMGQAYAQGGPPGGVPGPGGFGPGGPTGPSRREGGGRPSGESAVVIERRLPYGEADWQYDLSGLGDKVHELRREWRRGQLLLQTGAAARVLSGKEVMQESAVSPALAVRAVEEDPAGRAEIIDGLRAVLLGEDDSAAQPMGGFGGFGAGAPAAAPSGLKSKRAAITALRNIGGPDAIDLLYSALVGPEAEQQQQRSAQQRMMMPSIPADATRGRDTERPAADYVARALGSLGKQELLRDALTARGRQFFQSSQAAVQKAALQGLAYLPARAEAVGLLSTLIDRARSPELKRAGADALTIIARKQTSS